MLVEFPLGSYYFQRPYAELKSPTKSNAHPVHSQIDDAVGASAVHGFVGFWGLVAAGFTASDSVRLDAGYPPTESCSTSDQVAANLLFGILILIWVSWRD